MANKPVSRRLKRAMEEARRAFFQKFGRWPSPGDPIIFDPDVDEPTPMDPAKTRREMISTMKEAGIPGALVYAYEKTGLIVSEMNEHLISPADIAEYDAAIAEYRRLH